MNFGRITTFMCRGKLEKIGGAVDAPPPPKEAQALATSKGLKKLQKKMLQKNKIEKKDPPVTWCSQVAAAAAAAGRPLVAARGRPAALTSGHRPGGRPWGRADSGW
jgi:hypothetical protein